MEFTDRRVREVFTDTFIGEIPRDSKTTWSNSKDAIPPLPCSRNRVKRYSRIGQFMLFINTTGYHKVESTRSPCGYRV